MESVKKAELMSLLEVLPPVEFCCVYGSILHPNNSDKSSMVDYILGVSDPLRWHTENLKINQDHYASWMAHLGGAKLITAVAHKIGAGVHFNPFVALNDKRVKYGVVQMDDLIQDLLNWEKFYLCGRLQKPRKDVQQISTTANFHGSKSIVHKNTALYNPSLNKKKGQVHILADNLGVERLNSTNLRAAVSAALLLSPSKFSEENLYAKICGLSYMGDLRMLFAEDKNKVKKIVQGQFDLFRTMYKPFLEEYAAKDLLRFSSSDSSQKISQDFGVSASTALVSYLPAAIRREMGLKVGEDTKLSKSGQITCPVVINSREDAAEAMRKVVRRKVMVSSARQAVSGLIGVGAVRGIRYLGNKMRKAWRSWT